MPNIVRNKIFTEFAMETSKDSIKYMKPVFSKTQSGKDLNNRATDPDANEKDPWGYNDSNVREDNAFDANATKLHKGLYESTEDRYVQELANGTVTGEETSYTVKFDAKNFASLNENGEVTSYNKLIEGYTVVYYGDETHPILIQDKVSKKFATTGDFTAKVTYTAASGTTPATIEITDFAFASDDVKAAIDAELAKKGITAEVRAYARYDSEDDFVGDYLGEVQLKMWDYTFEPRPTTIGVTWSQLSELVLDSSFNVSAEEELVTYAAQEIRVALDYKAIRLAYQSALRNGENYIVKFNAGVGSTDGGVNAFGYKQNAQTLSCAITKVEDVMLNDIKEEEKTIFLMSIAA